MPLAARGSLALTLFASFVLATTHLSCVPKKKVAPSAPLENATTDPRCEKAGLDFRTAHKTNYEAFPDPGSEECLEYNGCTWAGQFAACEGKKSPEWVESHNIASLFPSFADHKLHDVCIRAGGRSMVVTILDTCADADCDGCCTRNKGSREALLDLEKATNRRFGLEDGPIEWADLGPTTTSGCE